MAGAFQIGRTLWRFSYFGVGLGLPVSLADPMIGLDGIFLIHMLLTVGPTGPGINVLGGPGREKRSCHIHNCHRDEMGWGESEMGWGHRAQMALKSEQEYDLITKGARGAEEITQQ